MRIWHCRVASTLVVLLAVAASVFPAFCQETGNGSATAGPSSFLDKYFARVDATQAEQPHWITPIATATPRLEEEFRADLLWQTNNSNVTSENYGGTKGLELIPFRRVEIILSNPPYLVHHNPSVQDGFGDFQFLIKYRLLSSNEEHHNYILTAFLAVSLPTGSYSNGALHAIITPTIAYGKGFGHADVQGTFGVGMPVADTNLIGRTYTWNNVVQYRVLRRIWPEVEFNSTFYQQGKNDGQKQVFVTPGLMVGRIHLSKRLNLSVGGGFQIAATHFHVNNHNAIFTVRFPF